MNLFCNLCSTPTPLDLLLTYQQLVSHLYPPPPQVQLLDRSHLLLRLGSAAAVPLRSSDSVHHNSFFVVYNFVTTEVLGFYQVGWVGA